MSTAMHIFAGSENVKYFFMAYNAIGGFPPQQLSFSRKITVKREQRKTVFSLPSVSDFDTKCQRLGGKSVLTLVTTTV